MAFQIKNFVSIAASILNHARATQRTLTDFNVGSVVRTLLEAPAIEIEELYQQMWNGLRESIPVAVFNSFDFTALAANNATGLMRVQVTSSDNDYMIPGGTVFTSADSLLLVFISASDVTIAAHSTYEDVYCVAVVAGSTGNVPIGTLFTVSPTVPGFLSATALSGFINGLDAETILEQKARFLDYIATISRGTVSAVKYGASTAHVLSDTGYIIESVEESVIIEPWLTDSFQPPGLVNLYIYNGASGASSALIAQTSKVIDGYEDDYGNPVPGWKAAGVKVVVTGATLVPIAVTGVVTVAALYVQASVTTAVTDAISGYIAALPIGGDVFLAEIVAVGMSVDGVQNFHVSVPTADTTIAANAKAMAGTFTITAD